MPYEIDFLNVGEGSGDSICLRHGDNQTGYTIHVIDGGHSDTAEKPDPKGFLIEAQPNSDCCGIQVLELRAHHTRASIEA